MQQSEVELIIADSIWYALYTRYQHEKSVARALESSGFEAFLPLQSRTHRWKDRFKKLDLPLFPSYVFLRGGLDRQIEVLGIPGVCWFVETGGRPAPIPEEDIEVIKLIIQHRLRAEPHPFLNCGDCVRVRGGPLNGVEGVLIRKKGQGDRLVISVKLLQRAVAVHVDALLVERVSPAPVAIRHYGVPRPKATETSGPAELPVSLRPMRRSACQP